MVCRDSDGTISAEYRGRGRAALDRISELLNWSIKGQLNAAYLRSFSVRTQKSKQYTGLHPITHIRASSPSEVFSHQVQAKTLKDPERALPVSLASALQPCSCKHLHPFQIRRLAQNPYAFLPDWSNAQYKLGFKTK